MAKESLKAKEIKRAKLVAKYAEKRAELKKIVNSQTADYEAKEAAIIALQKYRKFSYNLLDDPSVCNGCASV